MVQANDEVNQIIVIIPARIGSKRIPRKNLQKIDGKTLLAISIQIAKKIAFPTRVIVSTDSKDIATEATIHGAEIPFFRSQELSDDFSGTDSVVSNALDLCGFPDETLVCCMYPTAVLSTSNSLEEGLRILREHKESLVVGVKPFGHPIDRALEVRPTGNLEYRSKEYSKQRTQDLPTAFYDAGQFYWATAATWRKLANGELVNMRPTILSKFSAFDIDDFEDLEFVKQIFGLKSAND